MGVLVLTRHLAEDAVDVNRAEELLREVPPYVGRYAVTHALELSELRKVAALPIDTLQLHDAVAPEVAARLADEHPELRLIKALPIIGSQPPSISPWPSTVDAILLDSADPSSGRIGGTGQTHDWAVSAEVAGRVELPVILAGGLRPDNVATAVEQVRPWGVNVNSGVELEDGAKSVDLVREFVAAANEAQLVARR